MLRRAAAASPQPLLCLRARSRFVQRAAAGTSGSTRYARQARLTIMDLADPRAYMPRVRECNVGRPRSDYVQFRVGGETLGYLLPPFAERLCAFPDVFVRDASGAAVELHAKLVAATPAERTERVAVTAALRAAGHVRGWRDELFPVTAGLDSEPLFLIERACVSWFGLKAYGVHVNCYVEEAGGGVSVWVARRSATKSMWPNMLDHMVAGGLPYGLSPHECVVKECGEEASVPEALARSAVCTGAVSYETEIPEGLKRDVLLCFDLRLPRDFAPRAADGEVQEFMLWPMERVAQVVRDTREYKPNCCLVIIDFLIRRGAIEARPGLLELMRGLRAGELS